MKTKNTASEKIRKELTEETWNMVNISEVFDAMEYYYKLCPNYPVIISIGTCDGVVIGDKSDLGIRVSPSIETRFMDELEKEGFFIVMDFENSIPRYLVYLSENTFSAQKWRYKIENKEVSGAIYNSK